MNELLSHEKRVFGFSRVFILLCEHRERENLIKQSCHQCWLYCVLHWRKAEEGREKKGRIL
jgi:hypothetical protein